MGQALGATTDSILSISTPKGAFGAFYKLASTPSSDLKVTIDWKDKPQSSDERGVPAADGESKPV
jgi:hypothetical protein